MSSHEEEEDVEYSHGEEETEEDDEEEDEDLVAEPEEQSDGQSETQPRSHRETMLVHAEDLLHPFEVKIDQLVQEITTAAPPLLDDELTTKLNMYVHVLL